MNTPGAASGTMTLRNACHGVAPSTCAACSISHGICRKNADSTQIDNGNVNDMYGMISPIHVSYRPSDRHMSNSGPTRATVGNIATASAIDKMQPLAAEVQPRDCVRRERGDDDREERRDERDAERVAQRAR